MHCCLIVDYQLDQLQLIKFFNMKKKSKLSIQLNYLMFYHLKKINCLPNLLVKLLTFDEKRKTN